jgi:hypothetical protein
MKFIKPQTIDTSGTLTRASSATFIGSNGLLQQAGNNVARIDHEQGTGVLIGPLVEPAATNRNGSSSHLALSPWTAGFGFTRTASIEISGIDGTTANVSKFVHDATGTGKFIEQNRTFTTVEAGKRVSSLWVYVPSQAGVTQWHFLSRWHSGGSGFDAKQGAVYSSTVFNKWVRAFSAKDLSGYNPLSLRTIEHWFGVEASNFTTVPSGVTFYAQCSQDEVGTVPSSFIISVASAVGTRAADVMTSHFITNAVNEALSAYSAVTSYSIGNQVSYQNGIYESRINSNLNNTPTLGATSTQWLYVGPLNQYAMFDQTVESQTSAADALMVTFNLGQACNAIALLNVVGTSVRVVMNDASEGIVYENVLSLSSTVGINNWWRWLYMPIDKRKDIAFLDLPLYANATITVTIANDGADAKCGVCVVGRLYTLGGAEYGTGVGINDYSRITEDDFGRRIVTKRGYAKKMNVPISIPREDVDYAIRTLTDLRQEPLVWIASENYEATIVYGPYKTFEHVISTYSLSRMQLEIQGLV